MNLSEYLALAIEVRGGGCSSNLIWMDLTEPDMNLWHSPV
jgi:hypothetical protein